MNDPRPTESLLAKYASDTEVARLTAKADLILEELDAVVKQMSAMLREGAKQ